MVPAYTMSGLTTSKTMALTPSAIPPISSCSGISPLLTFFHPIPALSDR